MVQKWSCSGAVVGPGPDHFGPLTDHLRTTYGPLRTTSDHFSHIPRRRRGSWSCEAPQTWVKVHTHSTWRCRLRMGPEQRWTALVGRGASARVRGGADDGA